MYPMEIVSIEPLVTSFSKVKFSFVNINSSYTAQVKLAEIINILRTVNF